MGIQLAFSETDLSLILQVSVSDTTPVGLGSFHYDRYITSSACAQVRSWSCRA